MESKAKLKRGGRLSRPRHVRMFAARTIRDLNDGKITAETASAIFVGLDLALRCIAADIKPKPSKEDVHGA